ncbi:MAG TPA: nucleoside deaminase [Bacteroidota bacterium]|nr:nucleoside deaminase [Bacteroidota bacterium]
MEEFMNAALEEAKIGLQEGGIPIGAVLVMEKKIIGRGHNRRVQNNDPLAHAETECIRNAGRIGSYKKAIMFSTLMPCYYCAGALVQFGIDQLVVGDSTTFHGAPEFLRDHWVSIDEWNWNECSELMDAFIQKNPTLWNEDIGKL